MFLMSASRSGLVGEVGDPLGQLGIHHRPQGRHLVATGGLPGQMPTQQLAVLDEPSRFLYL